MRHSDGSGTRVLVDLTHSHWPRGLDQTFCPQVRVAVHGSLKRWPLTDCSVNSWGERFCFRPVWLAVWMQPGTQEGPRLRSASSLLFPFTSVAVVDCAQSTHSGQRWSPFPSTLLLLLVGCREEADTLECLSAGGQAELLKAVLADVFSPVFVGLLSGQSSPCPHSYMFGFFFPPCTCCTIEINSDHVKGCKDAWSSFLPEMDWDPKVWRCRIPPRLLVSLPPDLCKGQNDVNSKTLWNFSNAQMPSLSCHHH